MFVFTKWQKFIECRKAVLYDYHYPTQEKLGNEDPHDSNGIAFFDMLMKESKDEHRDKRFTVYKRKSIWDFFGISLILSYVMEFRRNLRLYNLILQNIV